MYAFLTQFCTHKHTHTVDDTSPRREWGERNYTLEMSTMPASSESSSSSCMMTSCSRWIACDSSGFKSNDIGKCRIQYLHADQSRAMFVFKQAYCVEKKNKTNEKSAQRDANTARALAVVRFGHRPPAVRNPQTGPTTIHCAAAS